jgi:hypothetical protein
MTNKLQASSYNEPFLFNFDYYLTNAIYNFAFGILTNTNDTRLSRRNSGLPGVVYTDERIYRLWRF